MKKNRLGMLVLLVVLILVVGFYLFASSLADDGDEEPTPDTTIVYLSKDMSEVTEIVYQSDSRSFGIKKTGSIYTLVSDPTFPLDQTVASSMAEAVAVITFERSFRPEGDDLTDYGLNDPAVVLTVSYEGGAKLTLEIGSYNRYSDTYYCQLGDGFVYLMKSDLPGEFDYTMIELLQDEAITRPSDGSSALTKVTLSYRDGNAFTYERIEGKEEEEDTWRKVLSDGTVADGEYGSEVLALYRELFMVSLSEWTAYNVIGEEALSAYGLDTPAVSVVFYYNETVTHTPEDGSSSAVTTVHERAMGFLIGDRVPEEDKTTDDPEADDVPSRYFLLEGGKVVYLVSEDELTQVLS